MVYTLTQVLAEGKGGTARDRPKEAVVQSQQTRRTETAYKAPVSGKSAQQVKALDSGDTVNAAVA
jgi:hypothetical protein